MIRHGGRKTAAKLRKNLPCGCVRFKAVFTDPKAVRIYIRAFLTSTKVHGIVPRVVRSRVSRPHVRDTATTEIVRQAI